jgi:protein-tyrosine phosphatase
MYIRIPLEGSKNTRDLGGYPTKEGALKFNQLFRSDNLSLLTKHDVDILESFHIKHVIDLRHHDEILKQPSKLPDFTIKYHYPLITDIKKATSDDFYINHDLHELYIEMLATKKDVIFLILETLMTHHEPMIFHCTAGKDRTGVIAMLVLGILGVSNVDIVSNYEMTFQYLKQRPDMKHYLKEDRIKILKSDAIEMEKTIDWIEQHFQSIEQYVLTLGITHEQIKNFKTHMIVKKETL